MTDRTHLTLRVELDPQDGSIAGRVLDEDGAGRSFLGWVGMAAAIEDVTAASARHRGGKATPPIPRQTSTRKGQEEK